MAIIVPIVSSWNPQGLDRAIADIKRAEGAFATFTAATAGIGGVVRNTGRALTYNLALPLGMAAASAISTAADFEVSMAQIGVATDTPVAGLKQLNDLAIQLGKDTIFSTNEAAAAMLELAKAGIKPAEIQAGALANTLDLAAAGGISLTEAAMVMSAGMNTFNLGAADSTQIVDALAGAANASSADIYDISLALQQVGQQAVASGLTIQETTGALAAFADAGVKGSDAGTSFKTFLQRLTPVSRAAREEMLDLGLEFFDTNGNMKSLTEITAELTDGFKGLTQEERLATMQTIFGSDSLRAANILYTEGAAGVAEYIKATSESGNAAEMAAARNSGLSGAIESLKGSIETASKLFGDAMAPTIFIVADAIKSLFDAFTNLSPEIQRVIAVVVMLAIAAGPVLWIMGSLIQSIGTMVGVVANLGKALIFLTTNPIGILITVLALLGLAIYAVIKNWDEIKASVTDSVNQMVADAKRLWANIKEVFAGIGAWFVGIGGQIVDGLRTGISNAWAGFKSWFISMIGQPIQWAKDILHIKSPSQVFEGIGQNVVAGYIKGVEGMTSTLQNTMQGMAIDSTVALNGQVGVAAGGANGAGGGVYNITVNAGVGTDGGMVGREIVDAIKRFERSSGQVFASA